MTLQNKTAAAAQTAKKLTWAEKTHNEPAVDNTELQETYMKGRQHPKISKRPTAETEQREMHQHSKIKTQ